MNNVQNAPTVASTQIAANPMLSDALYNYCIKYASRQIRFEKVNADVIDVVHDCIIEKEITYSNYQKVLYGAIKKLKGGFKAVSMDVLFVKKPLQRSTQDFICRKCKDVHPECNQVRYFSSKGFWVTEDICNDCEKERKRVLDKYNYRHNKNGKRDRRIERYHKTKKLKGGKKKTDWDYEKKALSDKYLRKAIAKSRRITSKQVTEKMITDRRYSILNPPPKLTKEERRERYNKLKMEKYYNDKKYREEYLKKVSEYTKANKDKRRLARLKLKEACTGI